MLGTVVITAPDPGDLQVDFLQETIQLSDGTIVEVNGGERPTLDIRAGVRPEAIGELPTPNPSGQNFDDIFLPSPPSLTDIPSSANITVGNVVFASIDLVNPANSAFVPDGLVLLTNQYEANTALPEGNIRVTGEDSSGISNISNSFSLPAPPTGISTVNFDGPGGDVFLDARNDIEVINSAIATAGFGEFGDIVLLADGDVTFDRLTEDSLVGAFSIIVPEEPSMSGDNSMSTGGDVRISATNLNIHGALLSTTVFGTGNGEMSFSI